MTRVVIGGRNRVLMPYDTVFVSGATLLADPNTAAPVFERATQIIWTWYSLDADGAPDIDESLRGTKAMLETLAHYRRPLVMLSTDAVFSGLRGGYAEDDIPDPQTDYARIKLAQEGLMVDHPRVRFTTFGPSYNMKRPLLIEMVARGAIKVMRPRQYFSPISTTTLDRVLRELPPEPRVYHLTSAAIDKTMCCRLISEMLGAPIDTSARIDNTYLDLSLRSTTHRFTLADEISAAATAWRRLATAAAQDV